MMTMQPMPVFQFCDLAGVENAKKAETSGKTLKETGKINSSLSTLRQCIEVLRYNQHSKSRPLKNVPFRESKLTSIFEPSFTGNGTVMMLVLVDPSTLVFDETLKALKFAALAQSVVLPHLDLPCTSASLNLGIPQSSSSSSSSSSSCSNKSEEQECGACLIKDTEIEGLREQISKYKKKYRAAKTKIHALEIKNLVSEMKNLRSDVDELKAVKVKRRSMTKTGGGQYKCPQCSKVYKHLSSKRRHIRDVHEKKNKKK